MKNYIKKWSLILLTVFAFQACETVDFGDTNVNPNSPSTASTAALLTNAESFIPTIVSEVNSNLMVQYISEITYTEDSRYEQEWPLSEFGLILFLDSVITDNFFQHKEV